MINVDTNWYLTGSPNIVVSPLSIAGGVTLTVQPGVEMRFTNVNMVVDGTL